MSAVVDSQRDEIKALKLMIAALAAQHGGSVSISQFEMVQADEKYLTIYHLESSNSIMIKVEEVTTVVFNNKDAEIRYVCACGAQTSDPADPSIPKPCSVGGFHAWKDADPSD